MVIKIMGHIQFNSECLLPSCDFSSSCTIRCRKKIMCFMVHGATTIFGLCFFNDFILQAIFHMLIHKRYLEPVIFSQPEERECKGKPFLKLLPRKLQDLHRQLPEVKTDMEAPVLNHRPRGCEKLTDLETECFKELQNGLFPPGMIWSLPKANLQIRGHLKSLRSLSLK